MKRKIYTFLCLFIGVSLSLPLFYNDDNRLNAATNYSTGSKVFIGNDSYTVIDPNTMTLLKDTATDAGEVTWNNAVASLSTLANNYGELGSKIVSNKFTLPKTSDLTLITNNDNTALINIDSINTDWWLGDESVDNRSKFVGADTNSLVTDVSIIKNVLDEVNRVCNLDQTVTEQGIKVTETKKDDDVTKNYEGFPTFRIYANANVGNAFEAYPEDNCTGQKLYTSMMMVRGNEMLYDTFLQSNFGDSLRSIGNGAYLKVPHFVAYSEMGLDEYIQQYISDPSNGYSRKFNFSVPANVCKNLKTSMPIEFHDDSANLHITEIKSYKTNGPITFDAGISSVSNEVRTLTCEGQEQTAGTSSVRPLLTLDKSKIAYSSNTKPTFDSNSSLTNAVPMVDGNNSYLSITDSDLGIALDSGNSNVSGNKLKAKRENPLVSIPVSLSGTTSGSRYVSAVAETDNGMRYSVLGQINGNKGTVELDLTSLKDFQTTKEFNVTLYQEVDEGTNTTYRGNAKEITIEIEAAPITDITFTPNYSDNKNEFSEGDNVITTVGEIVGSFTFTGGTSGVIDPTSGKDYLKYEIVDSNGNSITDSNFRINKNELILKQKLSEGTYTLTIKITDNANETFKKAITIEVNSKPMNIDDKNKHQFYEFQLSDGSIADIKNWQKENIIIHPKHPDYNKMKVDNGTYQTGDHTYSTEGENTVSLSFQKGNSATTNTIEETLKIDKSDPEISSVEFSEGGSVKSEGSGTFQYLFKNEADITINAEDGESGIARYIISATPLDKDGNVDSSKQVIKYDTPSTDNSLDYTLSKQGCYLIEISVEDKVGHKTSYDAKKIKISDQTIELEVKGYINNNTADPYDEKKWTNESITLRLTASDDSVLTNQQISLDQNTWHEVLNGSYTIPNTSSVNDETYYVKAVNIDGEEITASIQIKIDTEAPEDLKISYAEVKQSKLRAFLRMITFDQMFNKEQDAKFTANDTLSGIDYYEYVIQEIDKEGDKVGKAVKGKGSSYRLSGDKNYEVRVKAYDKAGNASEEVIENVQIDTEPPIISGVKDKSEYKYYYLPRYIKVYDAVSGLSYGEYNKDGSTTELIENEETRIEGVGEYEIYAEDNAGNDITITFKIVPLPDIETEIDGSDESKDIIDQIIDELDEIKDKIDETEKQDIEDWIKDALDKWNSLRKKVVETDDKSAKVEGQGDTDFDPSVILIVDDITDHADDIPPLPRKAIVVYDVWLQKGNVKIQPDGSIKVYLPYTEPQEALGDAMGGAKSDAKPIVYEIDTKDKVTELKVQREGSFVTFITDKLLRYAISNDKQEINKDDMCVVGPDGKPTTGDEVCGLPNDDGKQPVKKPDGSVEVPDGGKIEFPNGTEIDTPDGAIIHPDGSVTLPDGTEYDPDGNKKPSKQCKLDGTKLNIDTDGDGLPDVNIDLDKDCIADINVDMNGDNIPDLNIDSGGDGKPDINIDKNDDGKADLNILKITKWKPDKDVTINGITYDTMAGLIPDVNIDFDGDGEPDYNIDTDGDGIPCNDEN